MELFWLSYPLAATSLTAQVLISRKRRAGWAVQVIAQLGLAAYCTATKQYGFIPLNLIATGIAVVAFFSRRWRDA